MRRLLMLAASATGLAIGLHAAEPRGFFMDGFVPRHAAVPAHVPEEPPRGKPDVTVTLHADAVTARVSPLLRGDNANTYMGRIISEPVLLGHLKTLAPAVLRYPGGNLSNQFFWNAAPGRFPQDAPDSLIFQGVRQPAGYWAGRSEESLTLSVDNYYRVLEATGAAGLICVNYGYARYGTGPDPVAAAAGLAAEWVRYDNGRTRFWEVGNENFGPWQAGFEIDSAACGDGRPRIISGTEYGRHFPVFADSMRAAARSVGADIRIGAVMVEVDKGSGWYNPVEADWNRQVLEAAGGAMDFFSIHSYFTPYNENSSPEVILASAGTETDRMMRHLEAVCAAHAIPLKPAALTEWNIFATGSGQQTSFINAMHAALVLGGLAANRFGLAARWDLVNRWDNGNDHGLFNYGDEPGAARWNPRPAYFPIYYFGKYFGDRMIGSTVSFAHPDHLAADPDSSDPDGASGSGASRGDAAPTESTQPHAASSAAQPAGAVQAFASLFGSGQAGLMLVNSGTEDRTVRIDSDGFRFSGRYYRVSLTGGDDAAPFSRRIFVNGRGPEGPSGGPAGELERIPAWSRKIRGPFSVPLPARSVQFLLIEGKR
ncbi:alpha-L-arabinofuranosidase [bacterium]|nr:alpha-L-arabinofuranosidase [bacterium]